MAKRDEELAAKEAKRLEGIDTDIVGQDDDPAKVRASIAKLEARGKDRTITHGLKLNNPGLIKKGRKWKGLAPVSEHHEFCTFTDAVYGIRAIAIDLSERGQLTADPLGAVKAVIRANQGRDAYSDEVVAAGIRLAAVT